MTNPTDCKYTKEHEWIKLDGDTARVGITEHAQELLTDIVFVEMPEVGKKVEANGVLGTVESVKSVSDIFSPVAGEVIEVNDDLESKPELVNTDAFGRGWMVTLKVSDKTELEGLMSAEDYEKFIEGS